MPGKRNNQHDRRRRDDAAFAVPEEQRELDLTGLSVPVEAPETDAPAQAQAPKAGPPVRGVRSHGVGRSQGTRPTRQYAFRRS